MKRSNTSKMVAPEAPAAPAGEVSLAPAAAASAAESAPAVVEGGGRFAATVEPLPLTPGLYLFSVRSTAAPTAVGGLLLPAMHVGPGPGSATDAIEFLAGQGMSGAWLCRPGDRLVARVASGAVPLLLTSMRAPDMAPLLIAVENLDARGAAAAATAAQVEPTAPPPPTIAPQPRGPTVAPPVLSLDSPDIPLQIVAHIQNRGDVPFINAPWAGLAGQRLAIEGFSLSPLRRIAASEIECKALSATRSETPWVSGGALCGTRGKGLPLVGFCIRVKPQADGKRYDCEYSGTFASGKVVGPARNGAPCWSTAPGDFLEALQVKIIERPAIDAPKPAG